MTFDQQSVLAQSAIQILVPGFVRIPIPQNCLTWCSTDASGTLSGHSWSAPGTLQVVPEHSLGALGCPRRVPGPISDRFLMPRGPKLLQICSSCSNFDRNVDPDFVPNSSTFDPNFDPCVIKIRRNSIRISIHV